MQTINPNDYQRILLVGSSNSGKSTLGAFLHQTLDLPLVEIDDLAWQPEWQMISTEALRSKIQTVVQQPAWILVGNYGSTQDLSWPEAELVIWLDLPRYVVVWRSIVRSIQRTLRQTPVCNGNYESFRRSFLQRDSIILWVWNHYHAIQQRYEAKTQQASQEGPVILRLKTPREVRLFQARVRAQGV
jgi:adenylate kinase family enzyme